MTCICRGGGLDAGTLLPGCCAAAGGANEEVEDEVANVAVMQFSVSCPM